MLKYGLIRQTPDQTDTLVTVCYQDLLSLGKSLIELLCHLSMLVLIQIANFSLKIKNNIITIVYLITIQSLVLMWYVFYCSNEQGTSTRLGDGTVKLFECRFCYKSTKVTISFPTIHSNALVVITINLWNIM